MLLFTALLFVIIAQTVLLAYLLHRNASTVTEGYVDLQIAQVQNTLDSVAASTLDDLSSIGSKVFQVEASVEMVHEKIEVLGSRFKGLQAFSDDILDLIGSQTSLMTELEQRVISLETTDFESTSVAQTEASKILTQMEPVVDQEVVPMIDNNNDNEYTETQSEVADNDHEKLLKPPRQDGDPLITDLRAQPFEEFVDNNGNVHDIPAHGSGYEVFGSQKSGRPVRRTTLRRI